MGPTSIYGDNLTPVVELAHETSAVGELFKDRGRDELLPADLRAERSSGSGADTVSYRTRGKSTPKLRLPGREVY